MLKRLPVESLLRAKVMRGELILRTLASSCATSNPMSIKLEVRQVAAAGRGLFTKDPISHGQVLYRQAPLVACPGLGATGKLESVCSNCLAFFSQDSRKTADRVEFCGDDCESAAQETFLGVQRKLELAPLQEHCRRHNIRFPLLVARLAFMCLSKQASPDSLSSLCFAKPPEPLPISWVEEYTILRGVLEKAGFTADSLSFLSLPWYVKQISRLHINVFRVELVKPLNPADWLSAAAASIGTGGSGAAGSGVYLLPSMMNHSCDPNIDVLFPENNFKMELTARRDISAGEELLITYIDAAAHVEVRRSELQWAYGFSCQCPRCNEEASLIK
ncbi:hypothetical protein CYMTET_4575 [Cymbomonas tetramitiformis]|uniref:SET domain-containing protein n=1 Tax=Cymbomonas tetramitiformis TaxID=36881 RepID=A0AAE0H159_9CHLO|nr:hypothetical protein CYMTET_4575 [Cymbomonas tetramitiformis]